MTPIFKKGDKHLAENYRPVSLTCVCCKIMEHIICKHVHNHLDTHNILTLVQHGFRRKHCCESQLILTADDIPKRYNNYDQVDVVILDISKAFDKVNHKLLLLKIGEYGIDGKTRDWIAAFLHNRTQRVVVNGEFSSPSIVDSGVPQSTVLGLLLFLCYINDLP